jgi:hypothetical protein
VNEDRHRQRGESGEKPGGEEGHQAKRNPALPEGAKIARFSAVSVAELKK